MKTLWESESVSHRIRLIKVKILVFELVEWNLSENGISSALSIL